MTGILDQLRNWTPTSGDGRSDFDDDVKRPYRARVEREMVRVVKGATDLRDAMPSGMNAGAGNGGTDYANPKFDRRPFKDELGQPSPAQRELIIKLVNELMNLDSVRGQQAAEYTVKMTGAAAWKRGRGENTSRWIDTLITAVKHERSQSHPITAQVAAPVAPKFDDYADVTDGNYAIVTAGKTHFYRITRREGRGQYVGRTFTNIQERASAELFPVRGAWAMRKAILDGIRTDGVTASHLLYSERLTRCWHCNILLTDDTTNPYHVHGLGPVCGPKVMGPL